MALTPSRQGQTTSFAVKSAPRPDGQTRLDFHEKTMWRGRTIRPGDEVFVFAAEHHGGRGLVGRGGAVAVSPGDGSRVHLAVDHKLYRQATNKVAGLSDEAAAFLRGFF